MSYNAHDLSKRLLNALDNNYNVVDMHTVNEIISILEKFNITKELLETTRLGKHVNELRRKTSDTQLARRAKVLVKRWRDLVIPTLSPGHVGLPTSNRSSAERTVRRLGGTPLTSPALTRQVVSPAVPSPRLSSRPAWGGYESDSQDVILVEDDTPAPTPAPTPKPVKRPLSPATTIEEKKPKRDKKPKKRKDHAPEWGGRNGNAGARNGMRPAVDYTTLGRGKKVKTTQELLEQIQSRRATSPASPHSPDVMLIEPEVCPIKVDSPLRNGDSVTSSSAGVLPAGLVAPAECPPRPPLEEPREFVECTCAEDAADEACPAARELAVAPPHVRALHHALLPGINGTRAPTHPHQFAVRPAAHPDYPELFNSVVPLYNYSDYADDYCVKNMSRVPVCQYLPWREFAPDPPLVERPATPQPIIKEESDGEEEVDKEAVAHSEIKEEPSERLQPESDIDINEQNNCEVKSVTKMEVDSDFISEQQDHRTVERTKETVKCDLDGRTLYSLCETARSVIPYEYSQTSAAPVVTLPLDVDEVEAVLEDALQKAQDDTELTEFGKPSRPENFTEWHECAQLGDLIALPYVVID